MCPPIGQLCRRFSRLASRDKDHENSSFADLGHSDGGGGGRMQGRRSTSSGASIARPELAPTWRKGLSNAGTLISAPNAQQPNW